MFRMLRRWWSWDSGFASDWGCYSNVCCSMHHYSWCSGLACAACSTHTLFRCLLCIRLLPFAQLWEVYTPRRLLDRLWGEVRSLDLVVQWVVSSSGTRCPLHSWRIGPSHHHLGRDKCDRGRRLCQGFGRDCINNLYARSPCRRIRIRNEGWRNDCRWEC